MQAPSTTQRVSVRSGRGRAQVVVRASASTAQTVRVKNWGSATMQGSVRKVNEDRFDIRADLKGTAGSPDAFAGVYDGHGGSAVSEWLKEKLFDEVAKSWKNGAFVKEATTEAYLQADKKLLTPKGGFMGMGERGVGGSKCGATAATVMIYQDPSTGVSKLVSANVGDARTLLISAEGGVQQLTFDHVPDEVVERKRIEKFNPNPKMPLVRYIAGTWRVGGLLALSRAFGDSYLKGPLQFEGLGEGSDGYSSGFGVIAEPHITQCDLSATDRWVVISSDGLYAEEARGGGGGLENDQVAAILKATAPGSDLNVVAQAMATAAVKVGSTDDVTVVILQIGA